MALIRSSSEVDALIDEMVRRSNGKYITQGVTFNKESEIHLLLLKMVLMRGNSFGAFVREMLAREFQNELGQYLNANSVTNYSTEVVETYIETLPMENRQEEKPRENVKTNTDFGNFL